MISRLKSEMICAMSGRYLPTKLKRAWAAVILTEYDYQYDIGLPLHFSAVIHINARIVIIYISFQKLDKKHVIRVAVPERNGVIFARAHAKPPR